MAEFKLDERLQADTVHLASWPLCEVLLMNDCHYPWVILVPRIAGIRELYELDAAQRQQLDCESTALGRGMMQAFSGEKLNVAALGNVVSQLHIHHVVRFSDDAAWPAPIWGKHPPKPYDDEGLKARREALADVLSAIPSFAGASGKSAE